LVDQGIILRYSNDKKNSTIQPTTEVTVWTRLDYLAGVWLNFDWNGGLLLPRRPREVGYKLKNDIARGGWADQVTVESLLKNTVAD